MGLAPNSHTGSSSHPDSAGGSNLCSRRRSFVVELSFFSLQLLSRQNNHIVSSASALPAYTLSRGASDVALDAQRKYYIKVPALLSSGPRILEVFLHPPASSLPLDSRFPLSRCRRWHTLQFVGRYMFTIVPLAVELALGIFRTCTFAEIDHPCILHAL
jgi:hypothetical protein